MGFSFKGAISSSKSLFNRALICQSYLAEGLDILGFSDCEDVVNMKAALIQFRQGNPADCGHAGTVLRFLVLRASREQGRHIINGSPRLMSRPQDELQSVLKQLGVRAEKKESGFALESKGWVIPDQVEVSSQRSSQFASALLLNSWLLPKPLRFSMGRSVVSEAYWKMTCSLVKDLGLDFTQTGSVVTVAPEQRPRQGTFEVEPDMSSAFAVAALAALSGRAEIKSFPINSLQPDSCFVEVLQKMNVKCELQNGTLVVETGRPLKPINFNLVNCPDLFPVLSVLCAFAEGKSHLFGAPQLRYKESDRIAKTAELLTLAGVKVEPQDDGMVIYGPLNVNSVKKRFEFDSDQDHRLVMAASLLVSRGIPVKINHPEVVNKSFPEFLEIAKDYIVT